MKVTLKIKHLNTVENFSLEKDQTIILGRNSKADIKIMDDKASGQHCRLTLKMNCLELIDLNSKNGTYLNGIRIENAEVFLGDEIGIGESIVYVEENGADDEANVILTFPGPTDVRIHHELKVNFTDVRIRNQKNMRNDKISPKMNLNEFHTKEVEIRKKIKSRIKLSKEEIRAKHKFAAYVGTIIDYCFLYLIIALPPLVFTFTVPIQHSNMSKLMILIAIEIPAIAAYYLINFKHAKFTIGEKISGIQQKYVEQ